MNILKNLLISFIKSFRILLGGFGACKYAYSCTEYAQYQLQHESFCNAILKIVKRVISCNFFWKLPVFKI